MSPNLRIRLARYGLRNSPLYHIVVLSRRKKRNALPLEKLGEYDPIPQIRYAADIPSASKVFNGENFAVPVEKRVTWDEKRIRHWLEMGAEPTPSVVRLLEMVSFALPGCGVEGWGRGGGGRGKGERRRGRASRGRRRSSEYWPMLTLMSGRYTVRQTSMACWSREGFR